MFALSSGGILKLLLHVSRCQVLLSSSQVLELQTGQVLWFGKVLILDLGNNCSD